MLRTIPLRRFAFASRSARPRSFEVRRRPCGFTLCERDAVKLDVRTLLFASRFGDAPRKGDAKRALQCQQRLRSFLHRLVGASDARSRSGTTHHIKRHRFAHSPIFAGHASPLSLGAMYRYRHKIIAAWPIGWVLPSDPFGGAPGVHGALRRFAPASGWRIISDQAGPTCLFVHTSRLDSFSSSWPAAANT